MEYFVLVLEIVGTIAFAVSGSMLALQRKMDILGVMVMGLITACGGGVMRDLFLGQLPPAMFRHPVYALTAIGVALVLFLPSVRRLLMRKERAYESILLVADSLGLGIFTAAGVAATISAGYGDSFFFTVFLGTITGVGGGMLRDVLAGLPPYIFVKHVYACASIAGAMLCVAAWRGLGQTISMLGCVAVVFIVRLLAARYRWSLPKASFPDGELDMNSQKSQTSPQHERR